MQFVIANQLSLIVTCFLMGCLGSAHLFRRKVTIRAWKVADVIWVFLGGIGTLAAVFVGIYRADSSRLDRQIDIAYNATQGFDRDAARFRLAHCEIDYPAEAFRGAVRDLCDKVEFLSASTAENSTLPLFIAVTERAAPLQGLHLFFGSGAETMEMMSAEIAAFEEAEFLAFESRDEKTTDAVDLLRQAPSVAGIAAEFQVIATAYDDLIKKVMRLKEEWDFLQSRSAILALQVIALCMVAFAAPFRLGKSIVDLR